MYKSTMDLHDLVVCNQSKRIEERTGAPVPATQVEQPYNTQTHRSATASNGSLAQPSQ